MSSIQDEKNEKTLTNLEVTTEILYDEDEDNIRPDDAFTLRRVAQAFALAAGFILINEFCKRFAYYGGSAPFQNYIQYGPDDPDQAGALGKGKSTATALQNFFTFFYYFTPMLGALVADQYIGRYYIILIFSLIYMISYLILTTTASPAALAKGAGFPGYVVSLIVIGLGTGGIKGIVAPLCVDQYRRTEYYCKKLKSEEIVLVDLEFYWAINVGSLIGGIVCPLLELHVGFWAAFLLPTCMFVMSICVFVAGSRFYYKPGPNESVILKAWNIIKFANIRAHLPENKEARKASSSALDFAKRDPGIPVVACKIFVPLSIYWVCYNQLSNNLLSQAAQMYRPPGLPNDIMNNFDPIALIIFIPITAMCLYPVLRRIGINFASQAHITVGFFFGAFSMVYAAVVQYYIYKDPLFIETTVSSNISIFLQIPCYVLIAFSEILLPLHPWNMPIQCSQVNEISSALISLAISPSAHYPSLVWVYTGVAVGSFVFGIIYYAMFRHYDVIDEEYRLKKVADQDEGYNSNEKSVPETEMVAMAEAEAEAIPK